MADNYDYDLVVVGAGSAGLVGAEFAAQLGAHVALVEKNRVGGDCTWAGCVPSKALLRVARAAHEVRTANRFGIHGAKPVVDMIAVREYLRRTIQEIYAQESPETLQAHGIEVMIAQGLFLNPHTLSVGSRSITSKAFLLCTGARPEVPDLPGLPEVPYVTYEQIFENDRLPAHLLIIGGGPLSIELAQAYARLGADVTVVAERILPDDEPEAAQLLEQVLVREGVQLIKGAAERAERAGEGGQKGLEIVVTVDGRQVRGDMLLVAAGRTPIVDGLGLETAGVKYSQKGIEVDDQLRTSARHIYAAGDCLGGYQFTHFAGWQAFQATRNALLPGNSKGLSEVVPWVTYSAPEVAHVGKLEAEAREKLGDEILITVRSMQSVDRAVCEGHTDGFIKVVHKKDGSILGATVVADRAGEVITEFTLALQHGMKLGDLASAIHPYPTYSTPVQQIGAEVAVSNLLGGLAGRVIRNLAGFSSGPGVGEHGPNR